jgi:hypothetical protein
MSWQAGSLSHKDQNGTRSPAVKIADWKFVLET